MRSKSLLAAINIFLLVAKATKWARFGQDLTFPSSRRVLGCVQEEGAPETSYDVSLCDDLHVLQEEIDRREIASVQFMLDRFTTSLRTFVNEAKFDAPKFEAKEANLDQKLSKIKTKAEKLAFDPKIREHFHLNSRYLDLMRDSARYLKCFSSEIPENHLVCRVIDLHVRAFTFQTRSREFGTRFWDYRYKAIELLRSLEYLKGQFLEVERERDVPLPVSLMFHDQARKAAKILEACATRIFAEVEKFERSRERG